jgi:hypothetical protein
MRERGRLALSAAVGWAHQRFSSRAFLAGIPLLALLSTAMAQTAGQATAAAAGMSTSAPAAEDPRSLPESEWRKRLSAEQYYVLRQKGTERAGTSPLGEHCADFRGHARSMPNCSFASLSFGSSATALPATQSRCLTPGTTAARAAARCSFVGTTNSTLGAAGRRTRSPCRR